MAENRVHFGIKNVHYAVITYTDGVPSWGTPVAVPGGVSVTLSKEGSDTDFYADNVKYYHVQGNSGYTGTLEMASFPVSMREAIFGQAVSAAKKLLVENSDVQPAEFALMFETSGDAGGERVCIMRCQAGRPDIAAQTTTDTKEPVTQSCDLTAMPVLDPTENSTINGKVSYMTTPETSTADYAAFFSAVEATL